MLKQAFILLATLVLAMALGACGEQAPPMSTPQTTVAIAEEYVAEEIDAGEDIMQDAPESTQAQASHGNAIFELMPEWHFDSSGEVGIINIDDGDSRIIIASEPRVTQDISNPLDTVEGRLFESAARNVDSASIEFIGPVDDFPYPTLGAVLSRQLDDGRMQGMLSFLVFGDEHYAIINVITTDAELLTSGIFQNFVRTIRFTDSTYNSELPYIPHWAENYVVADAEVLIEIRARTAWNLDAIIQGMHNNIVWALDHAQQHHEGLYVTIHILDDLVFPDGRVEYGVTVMRAMFTPEDAQNADILHLRAFPEQVRDVASLFTVHQAYRQ